MISIGSLPGQPGTKIVTFCWTTDFGDCTDCTDCPALAAFRVLDAYGQGRDKPVCCVCAANDAADGAEIRRLDSPDDPADDNPAGDVPPFPAPSRTTASRPGQRCPDHPEARADAGGPVSNEESDR